MGVDLLFADGQGCVVTSRPMADKTLLAQCVTDVERKLLHRPPVMVYGKRGTQRRDVGFFSNVSAGYRYSGQLMTAQPLTTHLTQLLNYVNVMYGATFNGILVNRYRDGHDTIGAHSDDESSLDPSAVGVVALSVGATRKFRIRDKITKKIVLDTYTRDGYFLCMSGSEFQRRYTHEIPIETKVALSRLSFTFRHHTV